ncbi:hypothetical protein DI09_2p280 [Mitosporidium daphniae]|uniref:Peptidase S26 domain-containing protein n=1 Tax=Mitosporidium daphniae TaxID=1485682 RepID=A0A098VV95_9MICR|nr:uncharacterized protein DI09_2p280 [Mitosporidium daphniae]KGG51651.1 hypothetical protein DI09_2p280 [Mitosporidium daphniae]|eukprot:XP_013238078.1 uncharacterized protein DI09_2p280 [Mitosporidium daphniae]
MSKYKNTLQGITNTASVAVKVGIFSILLREYLFDVAIPSGPSMFPTLNTSGDAILIQKKRARCSRPFELNDVITAISPIEPKKIICKRISAKEGELAVTIGHEHMIIPKGHVWLLGDNPEESIDSRHYGPVPIGLIQGKAICKILPLSNIFAAL